MTKHRAIKQVYHLADERNWESIQKFGLLSAAQLLERANLPELIYQYRADNLELSNNIIIRDQRPMPPQALARCLNQDLTPANWYELLNRQVFFWIGLERLERQRKACKTPQYIMTIDAQRLLEVHTSRASVTPFNTGNAKRAAAHGGLASFVPYLTWVNSGWETEAEMLGTKPRSINHKPVELTIRDGVVNIFDFVTDFRLLR